MLVVSWASCGWFVLLLLEGCCCGFLAFSLVLFFCFYCLTVFLAACKELTASASPGCGRYVRAEFIVSSFVMLLWFSLHFDGVFELGCFFDSLLVFWLCILFVVLFY